MFFLVIPAKKAPIASRSENRRPTQKTLSYIIWLE
jgi:hypothetical protein